MQQQKQEEQKLIKHQYYNIVSEQLYVQLYNQKYKRSNLDDFLNILDEFPSCLKCYIMDNLQKILDTLDGTKEKDKIILCKFKNVINNAGIEFIMNLLT